MAARRLRLQPSSPAQIGVRSLRTPVGTLEVAAARSLLYIGPARGRGAAPFDRWLRGRFLRRGSPPALEASLRQLREYFDGDRRAFDLALDPGGTEFQRLVWQELLGIPFGETMSYGDLARRVGGGARAVGGAVGANPIPIVIPCHRIIGADGSLTGYSGGLRMKVWLLRHEGALLT